VVKTTQKNKKLVLLDAHAIIHRAYHALPEFINSKGEPTGAIYGLATMVFKIITELKPDYLVACYDLPKKTFRHEAYDNYKAGRAKVDDSLVIQFGLSRDFFKAFSVDMYELEGFEADDLLGTISKKVSSRNKNIDVIIASGDMDTLQLVKGDKVLVYTLKKGIQDTILYNEQAVIDRFGFKPKYLVDYKGLRGDPSDNIIGIKGIGDKTATILVKKFGSIENLYKILKKDPEKITELGITDRILNLLKEGEDEALFSKTLATIRLDSPIKFTLPKLWKEQINKDTVLKFFREMEFRNLQDRFSRLFKDDNTNHKESSVKESSQNLTIQEKEKTPEDQLEIDKAKIAFWLLNSDRTNPTLDEVSHYKGSNNLKEALKLLEKDIHKEKLDYVYNNIEIPIIPIIKKMEKNGVLIDRAYLEKLSTDYHKLLNKIEKEVWNMTKTEFNLNSPKQLSEVLFTKLALPTKGIKKSSSTGTLSTKESELKKLREVHPVITKILEYRELQKLLSTYIDNIPKEIQKDGRLHANFIQTGTTTGRFSSNNPNLQNIPIKTEKGKKIRNAFIAPKGYVLGSFDYSQIELRVAALMCQDPYFLEVFNEGKDIHTSVAMKVFGVKNNEVTSDMRRRAKVINFGILYGMGVNALKNNLGTDRKEAQEFYDNYFAQFSTIATYLESIKVFAREHGYTETLFGRKRYFPGIKSKVPFIRAMAERMATNAPIQGTATADIIKIGIKKVDEELKKAGLINKVNLILQIHDELIFEIKEEVINKAQKVIEEAMKNAIPREFLDNLEPVPLEVSIGIGKNWGLLK